MSTKGIAAMDPKTPPKGVSGKVMWDKLVKAERKLGKIQATADDFLQNATAIAVGAGTALAYGVLETKFPQIAKIPGTEIDTDLVLGGVMVFAGVITRGKMSGAMLNAGAGLLYPWLRDKGKELGAQLG